MQPRALLLASVFIGCGPLGAAAELGRSEWVHPDATGRLTYRATPAGDRIMDFSHAGYGGGGVALPEVPEKIRVAPTGGEDDTAALQAAIDRVAALPLEKGFRGAVTLEPGVFKTTRPLVISASGVVLRGSGSGARGAARSTLQLVGPPHLGIAIRRPARRGEPAETISDGTAMPESTLADAYVPSGATSFAVADPKGFAAGDVILLRRPVTDAWIRQMEMHDLVRDGRPQTWLRTGITLDTERRIAAIEANRITVDVPLPDNFDATVLNPPGTTVLKIAAPARITQSGVEYLHIAAPAQEINHSQAHFTALRVSGEDLWVRDVLIEETMDSVGASGRRITFERVAVNRKARHQGASKPAEFAPNASQILLDRCSVNADNVWFVATGAGVSGPIVVLNGRFRGNSRSESHQRWSTGMLYDNCEAPDGGIELRNRGSMGSGHGWSMGWGVVWNCVAKDYIVQNPPGAKNWLIGSIGHSRLSPRPFGSGPMLPGGTEDAMGRHVAPRSLYLAQLAERLGPTALQNIGYATPDPASARIPPPEATGAGGLDQRSAPAPALGANLANDRPVLTNSMRGGDRRYGGWNALDNDDATFWATEPGKLPATLELDTEGALDINAVALAEDAHHLGRVKAYRVEGFAESAWQVLAAGTTIGEHRVHRFPKVTVWKVRLTIAEAEGSVGLRTFGLYHTP